MISRLSCSRRVSSSYIIRRLCSKIIKVPLEPLEVSLRQTLEYPRGRKRRSSLDGFIVYLDAEDDAEPEVKFVTTTKSGKQKARDQKRAQPVVVRKSDHDNSAQLDKESFLDQDEAGQAKPRAKESLENRGKWTITRVQHPHQHIQQHLQNYFSRTLLTSSKVCTELPIQQNQDPANKFYAIFTSVRKTVELEGNQETLDDEKPKQRQQEDARHRSREEKDARNEKGRIKRAMKPEGQRRPKRTPEQTARENALQRIRRALNPVTREQKDINNAMQRSGYTGRTEAQKKQISEADRKRYQKMTAEQKEARYVRERGILIGHRVDAAVQYPLSPLIADMLPGVESIEISMIVCGRFSAGKNDEDYAQALAGNTVVAEKFFSDFISPTPIFDQGSVFWNGRTAWAPLPWAQEELPTDVVWTDFFKSRPPQTSVVILVRGIDGASIYPGNWTHLSFTYSDLHVVLVFACCQSFVAARAPNNEGKFFRSDPPNGRLYSAVALSTHLRRAR